MSFLIQRTALMLLLANFVGCSSWRATNSPLGDLEGERVRLTLSDDKKVGGLLVDSDSLGLAILQAPVVRSTVPIANITAVEKREINTWATAGLIVVGAAAVTLILVKVLVFDDPKY